MNNIREYLKKIGMPKNEFASKIRVSRPTLDAYITAFESGKTIVKERYQIIFDDLFSNCDLDATTFENKLSKYEKLFERDKRFDVLGLDVEAADFVYSLCSKMKDDMMNSDWNRSVYTFIEILLNNYRNNVIFRELAEYFKELNCYTEDYIDDTHKVYFANFYKLFSRIQSNTNEYDESDYQLFLNRRFEIYQEKLKRKKDNNERITSIINEVREELEKGNEEISDEVVIMEVLRRLKKK